MRKKGDRAKKSGLATTSFKDEIRLRIHRKILPAAIGGIMIVSLLLCVILNEYGIVQLSSRENLIMFVAFPLAASILVCLFISQKVINSVNEKYDDLDSAVQRLAIGHYNKVKISDKNRELDSLYSGLNKVVGQLIEKDSRIESIGKKCDQLESAHEGETCRWLGAKVDPEMIRTVLSGIEKMAQENRCDDILEILDDTKLVLEASLEDGTALRPLADELSRVKRYLEIYESVYQYRIGYRMSIMCNIVNYRIIPNVVLPAVQILFNKARESGCENYEIGVEVNSSFTNLLVIIRDNNGLASEDEFSYMVNDDAASRAADDGPITIGALNRRISSFYGKKYSVKLSSNKLGTAIYIYLPPVISDKK